jgi:hypothetical protein
MKWVKIKIFLNFNVRFSETSREQGGPSEIITEEEISTEGPRSVETFGGG